MKSFLTSKAVLPFLLILSPSAVGQMIRGGGNPWLEPNRCETAICPMIGCGPEFIPVVPKEKCCPVCQPKPKPPPLDCSGVQCRVCDADQEPIKVNGKCCPVCKPKKKFPDCSMLRCAPPVCAHDYEPVVLDGQCCPVCKPKKNFLDCTIVRCARPVCTQGYESVVPFGKCCPVCKPKAPLSKALTPCPKVDCTDPCKTFSTETNTFEPMCAEDEKCVTKMVYFGGDDEVDCPATACPTFVECN